MSGSPTGNASIAASSAPLLMSSTSFPQLQLQVRKPRLQQRENARQQIGRQRWNHPERQPAGEQAVAMTSKIDQIAGGREHVFSPPRDFAPDIGQHHIARPPFHHGDPERALQVAASTKRAGSRRRPRRRGRNGHVWRAQRDNEAVEA
jgi:hypothetical protein